ncbi:MAG: sigma-70 family RNA polymerase sigma factor [Planctomycetes bacterium]|nr:sigma-70 family RNA polymerase sigma factor [Planctomycetota bacterium]
MDHSDIKQELLDCRKLAFSIALKVLKNREDSEDIVQESYLSVLKQLENSAHIKSIKSYLGKTVLNKSYERLRKMKTSEKSILNLTMINKNYIDPELQNSIETVRTALAEIDREECLLINLAFAHDLSHREISEITGIPMGTVSRRISETKSKLKEKIAFAGLAISDKQITSVISCIEDAEIHNGSKESRLNIEELIDSINLPVTTGTSASILSYLTGGTIMLKKSLLALGGIILIITLFLLTKENKLVKPAGKDKNTEVSSAAEAIINHSADISSENTRSESPDPNQLINHQDTASGNVPRPLWRKVHLEGRVTDHNGNPLSNMGVAVVIEFGSDTKEISWRIPLKSSGSGMITNNKGQIKVPETNDKGIFSVEFEYLTKNGQIDKLYVGIDLPWDIAYEPEDVLSASTPGASEKKLNQAICFSDNKIFTLSAEEENLTDINLQCLSLAKVKALIIDELGMPIKGAYLSHSIFGITDFQRKSDRSGFVLISVPSDRALELSCSGTGYITKTEHIDPLTPDSTHSVTIRLEKGTKSLAGTCIDDNGNSISDVKISIEQEGIGFDGDAFTSKSDGSFSINGLLDKKVKIYFYKRGYKGAETTIERPDIAGQLTITLKKDENYQPSRGITGICIISDPDDMRSIHIKVIQGGAVGVSYPDKNGHFETGLNQDLPIDKLIFESSNKKYKDKVYENVPPGSFLKVEMEPNN